ncbi:MAG: hypothetical protein ACXV5T_09930 [Halobacteriota archaeon]
MADAERRIKGHYKMVRTFEIAEIVLYAAVAVFLVAIAVISLVDVLGNITSPMLLLTRRFWGWKGSFLPLLSSNCS